MDGPAPGRWVNGFFGNAALSQRTEAQNPRPVRRVEQLGGTHLKDLLQQRRLQDRRRLADGMQPALVHHRQPVAAHRLIKVMNGHHLGDRQRQHQVHQCQLLVDVQVIGGFIHQQDLRLLGQRPCNVDALAFTTGKLPPQALLPVVHAHAAQCLGHDLVIARRPALQRRQPWRAAQFHGIPRGDRIQRVGRLRHHGQLPGHLSAPHGTQAVAVQVNGALRGRMDACQDAQHAGLARPVRADQPQQLARLHGQRHVRQHLVPSRVPAHPVHFQGGHLTHLGEFLLHRDHSCLRRFMAVACVPAG